MSATSFSLKGGGWYKDGYASSKPGEKKKTKTEKKEAKKDTKKDK